MVSLFSYRIPPTNSKRVTKPSVRNPIQHYKLKVLLRSSMLSNAVGEVAGENIGKEEKHIPQGKSVMKNVFINMLRIRIGFT